MDKLKKTSVLTINDYIGDMAISKKIVTGISMYVEQNLLDQPNAHDHSYPIFKSKLNDLVFNLQLQNPTIVDLIEKMNNDEFPPEKLAFLSPSELNEGNWKLIKERLETTQNVLKNLPTVKWKKCLTCKENAYFWRQEQVRGSDEPMTSFYTCKKCNRLYKVNR